jgi:glutamate racemase
MTDPEGRERIGFLSPGIGALPALREALLARPDADFVVLSDPDLVAPPPESYGRLVARIRRACEMLENRGVSRIVPIGIPIGTLEPVGLPPSVASFARSLLKLELDAAHDATASGRVALVMTPALGASWPSARLESLDEDLSLVICESEVLGPVLDRSVAPDALSVAIVREVARSIREAGADTVVFRCPQAHLVLDLFRRALGPSIHIVSSPTLVARLLEPASYPPRSSEAVLSVLDVYSGPDIVADIRAYLQIPVTAIDRVSLPPLWEEFSMADRLALAYGAFDRGDLSGLVSFLSPGATLVSEIPALDCPTDAARALTIYREALASCVSVIHAFLTSGKLVGVTGVQVRADDNPETVRSVSFVHMFAFDGDAIREIRLLDATASGSC